MNKKITKQFCKFLLATITMLLLAGCSSSKEVSKKYVNEYSDHKVEITLFYTKDSDSLLKQENKIIVTELPAGMDKDSAFKTIEKTNENYKNDGVSFTINEVNDEIIVVQTVDYTKVDIEKATELSLDGVFNEDKKTVSLSKTEEALKAVGFKEVTE